MFILQTMRCLIFVSVIVTISAEIIPGATVFHKCCSDGQSLVKVSDTEDLEDGSYQCINRVGALISYNVTISPLVVGKNVLAEYGIPSECEEVQMVHLISSESDNRFTIKNTCYDRLELEIVNGTLKPYIPQVVGLSCVKNETESSTKQELAVNHFRKCCPALQSYDTEFHVCRSDSNSTEEFLFERFKLNDNSIYEIDNGLNCKIDQYSIELTQEFYSLVVDGSILKVKRRDGGGGGDIASGEWCVDQQYGSSGLVARVCSLECAKYGAYCVRKCCPIGHHYQPRRCGSFVSKCVPNKPDDVVLFNITDYLEPLLHKTPNIADIMGIRTDLHCPEGRIVLNKSIARDRHHLDHEGHLVSPISFGDGYCLEAFDNRQCPENNIFTTAVNCFVKAPTAVKNFKMSLISICISSVCLALTLVVYMSLPELRNLHGRTLICHVSMMLLAFCCLARVQYNHVPNATICTLLGYGIYFGFVAAFAWLNVMCFDIWWTFGSVRTVQPMRKADAELRRFLWYSLYAWSSSILLTLIVYLFDKYPVTSVLDANVGVGMCWFGTFQNTRSDWPHYIFFVIPMGLVTCTNFVLWVLTARHCARVKSEVHRLQAGSVGDRAKRRFRVDRAKYVLTGKLWVVMGAGWISELLSTLVTDPLWLWNIIDLINELQGVFIFLILVMKPKLYYLVRKRLGCSRIPIDTSIY
ncbi:probable G-protein coupled receptor Mth-like 3 isoform X2 [Trichoplusia ni]|uniref:Probable G-protein coupled receptor Mth-like 3 isoform X2 n=1 Tax=Trichoplusia ni TaxID=7111 RepID=A0A7E5WCN0_TRINI|nr:probable G-protein coupled receptor Mth-like 3 isoform X2 [Trichoplusia ni]